MQKPLISAFLFACLMIVSCGKSTDTPENADLWVVSFYNNDLVGSDLSDDTAIFAGYTFEFNANNQLVINQPDGSIKDAKWGSNTVSQVFSVSMDNPNTTLSYLMGDWVIKLYDNTDIKLERTDGSTATDNSPKLEFKKL